MTKIYELTEAGRDLVKNHDSFPEEEGSSPPREELEEHLRTHVVDDEVAQIDFDRLDTAVEATKSGFDYGRRAERTAMDSNLAPIVHECIDIPPRYASLAGFWQYVTLLKYPEFITTRWSRDDDIQEKFLGTQKDLYSNHFARLWWGAHLTQNEETGDYFSTHRLFNKQRLVNYLLDSSFRRYKPAARSFANVLQNERGKDITAIARRFNASLSTVQLEARSETEIADQLEKIRSRVV